MQRRLWPRIGTGVLIALIGLMLLLVTTDTADTGILWAWIPALFVFVGAWALVRSGFHNLVGPVMLMAIAGAFLLRSLDLIEAGSIGTWWPLFVVLFGVLLIVNRRRHGRRVRTLGAGTAADGPHTIGVFSNARQRLAGGHLDQATLVAVFGDAEVDLRDTTVDEPPAMVEASAVFGDATVRIPDDWEVRLDVLSIFGEVVDRRPRRSGGHDGPPELVVTGTAVFGDVELLD